jgi:hypothetical protein
MIPNFIFLFMIIYNTWKDNSKFQNHLNLFNKKGIDAFDCAFVQHVWRSCEDHLKFVFLNMSLTQEDEEAASVFKQEYVQEWWPSTKTVLQRQATLVLRNKSFVYARIVQVI